MTAGDFSQVFTELDFNGHFESRSDALE